VSDWPRFEMVGCVSIVVYVTSSLSKLSVVKDYSETVLVKDKLNCP